MPDVLPLPEVDVRYANGFERKREPQISHLTIDDGNKMDWDMVIETAPVRPSGAIRVRLAYGGRGKPAVVTDPRVDD